MEIGAEHFTQCPLLQKFAPHIDYTPDSEHENFGDKPQFNNYFINDVKNLGAHLFMNCEGASLYPHKALLEEARFTTCFNDYHDLMVAARLGYVRQIAGYNTCEDDTRVRYVSWAIFEVDWGKSKHRDTEIEEPLTRGRMNMCRVCVCVYHVRQKHVSAPPGITGECIAYMAFDCARYQVDAIAGDGRRSPHVRMQSFAVLDQQDGECGNTIKMKTLWKLSTCQGQALYFL